MILFLLLLLCVSVSSNEGFSVRQDRAKWQEAMADVESLDGVWQLDESTFDTMINWNNIVLVCFYEANA